MSKKQLIVNYDGLLVPANIFESVKSARERSDAFAAANGVSQEEIDAQWVSLCEERNNKNK